MELNQQGVLEGQTSSATQGVPASTSAVDPSLNQFLATSTEPSATVDPQGGTQGATQTDADKYRSIQAERDRVLADNLRLQQEFAKTQAQMSEVLARTAPQQAQTNPYDFQTDFPNWYRWENQINREQTAQLTEQRVLNTLGTFAQQSQEMQWRNANPDKNLDLLKEQARMRWGVPNPTISMVEDLLRITTEPNRLQQVAQTAGQQVANNFTQPQTSANPMRPSAQPVQQGNQYDFDKITLELDRDPSLINKMSPEFRKAYQAELLRTMQAMRSA